MVGVVVLLVEEGPGQLQLQQPRSSKTTSNSKPRRLRRATAMRGRVRVRVLPMRTAEACSRSPPRLPAARAWTPRHRPLRFFWRIALLDCRAAVNLSTVSTSLRA